MNCIFWRDSEKIGSEDDKLKFGYRIPPISKVMQIKEEKNKDDNINKSEALTLDSMTNEHKNL